MTRSVIVSGEAMRCMRDLPIPTLLHHLAKWVLRGDVSVTAAIDTGIVLQAGQRVAEVMADAFRKEGQLDVNFVKVVQINNAGTELL